MTGHTEFPIVTIGWASFASGINKVFENPLLAEYQHHIPALHDIGHILEEDGMVKGSLMLTNRAGGAEVWIAWDWSEESETFTFFVDDRPAPAPEYPNLTALQRAEKDAILEGINSFFLHMYAIAPNHDERALMRVMKDLQQILLKEGE